MNKYIIGNWKMNGTEAEGITLISQLLSHIEEDPSLLPTIVICPPYPYLALLSQRCGTSIHVGAQDCSPNPNGPFTGDVSVAQLKDVGCTYVIVGHSERRQHHHEASPLIRRKLEAALEGGLKPILCIGENLEDYKAGTVLSVLAEQLEASLPVGIDHTSLLIAYEPVWAIGTGITPTLEEVEKVTNFIKQELSMRIPEGDLVPILYGGSVNSVNAPLFLDLSYIDGFLVGSASLRADEFWKIIKAAES